MILVRLCGDSLNIICCIDLLLCISMEPPAHTLLSVKSSLSDLPQQSQSELFECCFIINCHAAELIEMKMKRRCHSPLVVSQAKILLISYLLLAAVCLLVSSLHVRL